MWRPDGWEETVNKEVLELIHSPFSEVETAYYEAGADAMLEALIKQGRFNYAGYGTTDFPDARWGWFVFIPEG